MDLNIDQEKALIKIKNWYNSRDKYYILDGAGGTGKSFLTDKLLQQLNVESILIAPTNEALRQLQSKVSGNYLAKTAHAALGMRPVHSENGLKFEFKSFPSFWEKIELVIADEASMYDVDIEALFDKLNCKILYIGHKSQLPPVKTKRDITDTCVSPIFTRGYDQTTLTIPMRNRGNIWDFTVKLEENIYLPGDPNLPDTFNIYAKDFLTYLNSLDGQEEILTGITKYIAWSNKVVDAMNNKIRQKLFGQSSKKLYLPGDKILTTCPTMYVGDLERFSPHKILKYKKTEADIIYTNTKCEVLTVEEVQIALPKYIMVDCWKLTVMEEDTKDMYNLYEFKDKNNLNKIKQLYIQSTFGKPEREKMPIWEELRYILSLFVELKHSYTLTAHRAQGSSINKVIISQTDISKNPCVIERKKCRYVAASRAMEDLKVYMGYI